MNKLKKAFGVGWRVGFCLALLLYIFHSIFMNEGKFVAEAKRLDWDHLQRSQQWHLAWTTGPEDLWHTLRMTHLSALIITLLLQGLILFIGVLRWRLVLETQGLHLPLGRATRISFVAQFFNSFLLGSTGGDLIKAYYAARETHHKKTEAVTTVFVDRVLGLWAMLLFAGLMMILNLDLLRSSREVAAPALFILAMFVGVTVVLCVAFWGGVSKGFPRARQYLRKLPKGEVFEKALDSCRQFGKAKGLMVNTVGISILLNVLWVIVYMVLGKGLDLAIPPIALFVIVPIIICISALPITPNGLGVRENLFVLMLGALSVPKTAALSVSLIASAQGLFWSAVGGLIYMGVRDKEHLKEVTQNGNAAKDDEGVN